MEKKEFNKFCNKIFTKMGFYKKGTVHFYKDLSEEIMLVIGLVHSYYNTKYWFDGGFVIKTINKHMPYPKYYNANIRTMDIEINGQYYIDYLNLDHNCLCILEESIKNAVDFYSSCCNKTAVMEKIIIPDSYEICTDYDMEDYFNFTFPTLKFMPDESQI